MALTIGALVKAHRERTDKLEEIEQRAKDEAAPIKKDIQMLEAAISKLLQSQGVQSLQTDYGTAYRQSWRKVKVQDWDAALGWVQEKERWDMLVHQLNKTAVLDETGSGTCPIPGVAIESGIKANVRRSR